MGKGGAQLGKAVKGRSKEKKKEKKSKLGTNLTEKQLNDDIKMLEEYERMNKLAEAQRLRLKKLQQQEVYNTKLNKTLLLNLHRKLMRGEKVDQLRKEIEILAQNHEREADRKDAIVAMLLTDQVGANHIALASANHRLPAIATNIRSACIVFHPHLTLPYLTCLYLTLPYLYLPFLCLTRRTLRSRPARTCGATSHNWHSW
jgi:hypothetical protein